MAVDLPINKIGGVPSPVLLKLKKCRINTIGQLTKNFRAGKTAADLAARTGIPAEQLYKLNDRCRIRQINGIGTIFEILLELAGITEVEALAEQDCMHLWQSLASINEAERLSRRSPTQDEVFTWIAAAKEAAKGG